MVENSRRSMIVGSSRENIMKLTLSKNRQSCGAILGEVMVGLLLSSSLLVFTAVLWSSASRDLAATRNYVERQSQVHKWNLPAARQAADATCIARSSASSERR